jgi:hypothetical protein
VKGNEEEARGGSLSSQFYLYVLRDLQQRNKGTFCHTHRETSRLSSLDCTYFLFRIVTVTINSLLKHSLSIP